MRKGRPFVYGVGVLLTIGYVLVAKDWDGWLLLLGAVLLAVVYNFAVLFPYLIYEQRERARARGTHLL